MAYKCLIIGDKAVGKSSLIKRHSTGEFTKQYQPTGSLLVTPLSFSTSQGQITFQVYEHGYYSQPDCAIIMFDVCNRESLEHVAVYYQWLEITFGNIPVVICGNKSDRKGDQHIKFVCQATIRKFMHSFHQPVTYFDISALSNYNFDKPFLFLWLSLNYPDKSYQELTECGLFFE